PNTPVLHASVSPGAVAYEATNSNPFTREGPRALAAAVRVPFARSTTKSWTGALAAAWAVARRWGRHGATGGRERRAGFLVERGSWPSLARRKRAGLSGKPAAANRWTVSDEERPNTQCSVKAPVEWSMRNRWQPAPVVQDA